MLLTKIHIPSPGKNLVHRTELFKLLELGLDRKLTLVSAPAGFGKTALVSDWIYQKQIHAGWFSIDNNDNDSAGFLNYLISVFQTLDAELGKNALELLKSPNSPGSDSIVNLLINDLVTYEKDCLLVLDDFHLINNIEILGTLGYLVEYMPENIHLVILSRSDPGIPVAKLRSQNQLVEIRSADLSFSAKDISLLFSAKLNTKLSKNDIWALESKTEGWIAGLQLAALSMQAHENKSEFIEEFAGNNRYIMDYLIEEVLKTQTEDVKEFLLKTSILDQFSSSLCNSLLGRGESQTIIEKLESSNMFIVPLDSERKWFRYHHLFADLLKQRLLLKDKSQVDELHSKASTWFEENDMVELAIKHSLNIGNYERSIYQIEKVVFQLWRNGQHNAISNYGEMLPDTLIHQHPEFCLFYCWVLIAAGQLQKAEPFLISAEKITKEKLQNTGRGLEDRSNLETLSGKISVAFAYLYSHDEQSDKTLEYSNAARQYLSDDDPLWLSWAWFTYAVYYFSRGELNESLDSFHKAFDFAVKTGNIYLISAIVIRMAENEQQLGNYKSAYKRCKELLTMLKTRGYSSITKADWTYAPLYFILGITELIWVQLDKSYENIRIAYELSKDGNDLFMKVFILMVYSVTLHEQGNHEAKERILELDTLIKESEISPFLKSFYIGWKVHLCLEKDQIEEAGNIFNQHGVTLDIPKTHVNETVFSSYARYLIAKEQLSEAEKLVDELYEIVSPGMRIERMIDLKNIKAIIYHKYGEEPKAVEYLLEAMEMAAPQNLLSYFAYNNSDLKEMLVSAFKVIATQKTNIPKKFVEELKQAIERKEKIDKKQVAAELSSRELDTLKLIAHNYTNQEIADKLFISLNTVKTHLKNINLKLEVDNRNKAVSKAKELGLL